MRWARQVQACALAAGALMPFGAADAAPGRLTLAVGSARVARYTRVEFTVGGVPAVRNPFDPAEADVSLEIRTPGGRTLQVPAFWCREYERRQAPRAGRQCEWLYPAGEAGWRARFAPPEPGDYSCTARLKAPAGEQRSAPVRFTCTPSAAKGYLRVSKKDPRFFALDDGTPFFAIGQDVAFVKDTDATIGILRKMAANGANYARIWTGCYDWALAVEAPKSAWLKGWDHPKALAVVPEREDQPAGRKLVRLSGDDGTPVTLQPCNPIALRPNTRYVLSGAARTEEGVRLEIQLGGKALGEPLSGGMAPFRREFTTRGDEWWLDRLSFRLAGKGSAWVAGLSLKEAGGGPELLEEADVNRPPTGTYNQVDCAMLDRVVETAEACGIRLELCFLARDLYMDRLKKDPSPEYDEAIRQAKALARYMVARWGYSTGVAAWEYFNEMNPGLPTDRFYREMGEYLERADPYHHLRATSAWSHSPKDWHHPKLDQADLHWYLRPAEGDLFKDEVTAVLRQAKLLRENAPAKPALFAEFGMTADNWGRSPYQDRDPEYVHLHNGLWASALSGLSGAVMSWFWEDLDKYDAYHHYRPLADFTADIPFTTAGLRAAAATIEGGACRVVGLQGSDCAFLWLFNPEATWWKVAIDKAAPTEVKGLSLSLAGLAPGDYAVVFYDTRTGKTVGGRQATVTGTALRVEVPAFTADIACKIRKGPFPLPAPPVTPSAPG